MFYSRHSRSTLHSRAQLCLYSRRTRQETLSIPHKGVAPLRPWTSLASAVPKGKTHRSIEPNLSATVSCICRSRRVVSLWAVENGSGYHCSIWCRSCFRFWVPALRTPCNAKYETETRWYFSYREGLIG